MEFTVCECGNDDFFLDMKEWERSCTQCGLVSCIDFSLQEDVVVYHYQRDVYFNHLIDRCIQKGAPIGNHARQTIMSMFLESSRRFEQKKQWMQRQNYPSFQYALLQLAAKLNIDVSSYIKLPKMKSTLERVKSDWNCICPY